MDLLINHNVPLQTVLSFVAFVLPFSMTFTIPWGFLQRCCLCSGVFQLTTRSLPFVPTG